MRKDRPTARRAALNSRPRWLAAVVVVSVAGALAPVAAAAEEAELQVSVSPMATAVQRHGAWHRGEGVALGARVGIPPLDWFSVELCLRWDQGRQLYRQVGPRTRLTYGMQRLGANLGVVARRGSVVRLLASAALGYRLERRHSLNVIGPAFDAEVDVPEHRIVAALTAAAEWRWSDRFSGALWLGGDVPTSSGSLDVAAGVSASLHLWK